MISPNLTIQFQAPPPPPTSNDELLSDFNWQPASCPPESSVKVTSVVANAQSMTYTEDTNFTLLLQSYDDVFDDTSLPEMKGDAFKINLKPDAQPYAQAKARKIPILTWINSRINLMKWSTLVSYQPMKRLVHGVIQSLLHPRKIVTNREFA